jgi:beta-glucosidase
VTNKRLSFLSLFLGLPLLAAAQQPATEQRITALLQQMTLEEKVGQLNQYSGRELTGPASARKANQLSAIRSGQVGSMLNAPSRPRR